jgi:hypothetical protein
MVVSKISVIQFFLPLSYNPEDYTPLKLRLSKSLISTVCGYNLT